MVELKKGVFFQMHSFSCESQKIVEDGTYGIVFRERTQVRTVNVIVDESVDYDVYVSSVAYINQDGARVNVNALSNIEDNQPEFNKINEESFSGTANIILPEDAKAIKIVFSGLSENQGALVNIKI